MPTTPGCQPSPAAQTSGASRPRASAWASAASRTRASISRRSVFSSSSRSASAARLVRVVGGQQPRAEVGLADAAAGIDPRAEEEAEVIGRRRLVHPRDVGQRHEARPLRAAP